MPEFEIVTQGGVVLATVHLVDVVLREIKAKPLILLGYTTHYPKNVWSILIRTQLKVPKEIDH